MQDYHGSNVIVMGNGNTIPISHTGNVNINASNHKFHLQNFSVLWPLKIMYSLSLSFDKTITPLLNSFSVFIL